MAAIPDALLRSAETLEGGCDVLADWLEERGETVAAEAYRNFADAAGGESGFSDGYGYGSGDGHGDGYGYGYGSGDGSGSGYGYGSGDGYGSGSGDDDGYGYGSGYGVIDGYGDGHGVLGESSWPSRSQNHRRG